MGAVEWFLSKNLLQYQSAPMLLNLLTATFVAPFCCALLLVYSTCCISETFAASTSSQCCSVVVSGDMQQLIATFCFQLLFASYFFFISSC